MRMGGVARFARARPRAQQAGAIAGVALLASAPFGGWSAVGEPDPEAWTPDESFAVGPFEVTIDRAVTVADLGPTIQPATEGNHLLAVVAKIENVTDRMERLSLLIDAVRPGGAGVVDDDPAGSPGKLPPTIYIVEDTSEPRLLNPHVGLRVILVWEQDPEAAADSDLRLDFLGYDFIEESTLTLDANYWLLDDEVSLSGKVAVAPVEDEVEDEE